jgi:hypothetical protein
MSGPAPRRHLVECLTATPRRPLHRGASVLLSALLAATSTTTAQAEQPPHRRVRLQYQAPPGCTAEKMIRYLVGSKLRADPFDPNANAHLAVTIERARGKYTGRAELTEPGAVKPWSRSFPPMTTCDEIVDALVFAVAVHLDPVDPSSPSAPSPPPSSPSSPTVVASPALSAPELPRATPPEPPARVVRLGAGAAIGLGVSPANAAPGVTLEVGLRWLRWAPLSIAVEGRAYPSASATKASSGATVTTGRYTGAVVPCAHLRVIAALELSGCALLELGALRIASDAPKPTPATRIAAASGLRGGVELPLSAYLALRATGDALVTLRRYGVSTYGSPVWETPPVSAGFSLGAIASF